MNHAGRGLTRQCQSAIVASPNGNARRGRSAREEQLDRWERLREQARRGAELQASIKGLIQADVAMEMRMDPTQVSAILNGRRLSPNFEQFTRDFLAAAERLRERARAEAKGSAA